MDKNLLIVAGDPSGDLHAANLVRALKAQDPDLRVVALGGRHLKEVSDHFLFDLASLGISGFLEPLKRGLLWSRLLHTVRNTLQSGRISAVVCVDFYGFNHQVLGMAKHRHIPTFYYISPRVNPKGPLSSPGSPTIDQPCRVRRGGSFLCADNYCRRYLPAARDANTPVDSASHTGFRCVQNR